MLKLHGTIFCVLSVLVASVLADEPKEDVAKAAKALAEKENYSWKTTVTVPPEAQFRPGPTEGKIQKGGPVWLEVSMRDTTSQVLIEGDKIAMNRGDEGWQSGADLEKEEGFVRFIVQRFRNYRAPAEQAEDILKDVKDLKKEGDVYAGDLTEEGAKNLMRFRRGGDGPDISNAKGSARFWIKDGVLSKLEYKVKGTMNFNGNDIDVDRLTTTEVKGIGTTKVTVPEGAEKKLS